MDHHCPWTGTCVSLQTFPSFLRFVLHANLALWYHASLVLQRARCVWADRGLPAYLGPSPRSLVGLTVLGLAGALTTAALGVMLYTAVRAWVWNSTMIEDWEQERHEAVLARMGREEGGWAGFWGDDDAAVRARLERIEYPYDLGVFANMAQAMGTRNFLRWLLPVFGGGPVVDNTTPGKGVGWEWEENGFNDLPGLWPPPDPEKARRAARGGWPAAASLRLQQQEERYDAYQTPDDVKAAFARRQEEDLLRQRAHARAQQGSGIIAELEEVDERSGPREDDQGEDYEWVGKPLWTNSEGDTLWDYGVDDEVEDGISSGPGEDEDVPLAELIRRRKVLTREEDG
ncbi:hypothetical protein BT67DRAFT_185406 [Trichocladium antarcticum]|uniref:Palmitoyltransferase n=1 Tax=Trichocladium antarcticum TaxID=1450529 RepID=A0AAN6UP43_9PEZI|nr:hypothetical protein BT67DRAFT_185406 [Trichocladium antarcticum]